MAVRSLGQLTIDLIMKTGGFVQGWTAAERESSRAQQKIAAEAKKRAKETEEAWKGARDTISNVIGGALAGIGVGAGFQKFLTETVQAQKEQAGLAAALKATGSAAGFSIERLNEMAGAMEAATGIAAGELNQAQKVLTGFTNIVGENYAKALQSAADYSAYTGQSMVASAELMGRALNIPSVGMAALAKQGFKFTEEQIKLAKSLEETGRVAEAQQIVFDALEETYGGAAVAARDTLGGAMSALKNTINSLMTGEGGSVDGLKKAINDMTNTLSNEQTRGAFQTLITWMAQLATMTIQLTANLVAFIQTKDKLGAITGTDEFGKMTSGAKAAQKEVERLTSELGRMIEAQSENPGNDKLAKRIDAWRTKLLDAQTRAQGATSALKTFADGFTAPTVAAVTAPDLAPRNPGAIKLKDETAKSGRSAAERQAERDKKAAEAYLKALVAEADGRKNLTKYGQVLYDIEEGRVKLTEEQADLAKAAALESDKRVTNEMLTNSALEARKSLIEEGISMQQSLLTPQEKYVENVQRINHLLAEGAINQETYGKALGKYYEDLTGVAADYAGTVGKGLQNILGDELSKGLDASFKNILGSFAKMLLQMEAQALSANLMSLLGFGPANSGGGGGLLGKLFTSVVGGLFGGVGGGAASSAYSLAGSGTGGLGLKLSGFRAAGGPVTGGSMYRVNELGPELLNMGGKDYLMMGGQGGYVKPLGAATTEKRGAGNVTIVNQTTGRIDNVEQRQLTHDDIVMIIQEQTPKVMVSQTQNANSPFSRTMQGSFNTSRRR